MISRDQKIGVLCLLSGVGLFSTVEIAGKMIGTRVDPVSLTFIRFLITGLVLLAISAPVISMRIEPLRARDYLLFLLNGFIGISLSISIFHAAILAFEKAASAAVVFSANPIFVIVLARFVNGERWTPRKWIGALIGLCGVLCFAWESGALNRGSVFGIALMLLSALLFALSICISKRIMPHYGAIMLMGFSALFGSLLLAPFAAARMWHTGLDSLWAAWLPVLYISVIGTAVAYALYYFGILNTSADKGSMTFFLKPVLASILAALILGERINSFMITGMLLILAGLMVVVLKPGAAHPAPQAAPLE